MGGVIANWLESENPRRRTPVGVMVSNQRRAHPCAGMLDAVLAYRSCMRLRLAFAVLAACSQARTYTDTTGPRYAGGPLPLAPGHSGIKVVSFNIRYAGRIDLAADLLTHDKNLRDADVVTLQEMDAPGVAAIAEALGCRYVYYPAAFHPAAEKDFGNAVLSRWPILEDHKVLLPHASPILRMRRIAVAATINLAGAVTRVYSLHLEAPLGLTPNQRREQLGAVIADAKAFQGPVIIAGDFNNRDLVSHKLGDAGYDWATRNIDNTIAWFAWDHVFVRGLLPRAGGVGPKTPASDHAPIWVELAPLG
jgi:endonuclease/exonuclease/phosphatase family metal-dependent hydrolase